MWNEGERCRPMVEDWIYTDTAIRDSQGRNDSCHSTDTERNADGRRRCSKGNEVCAYNGIIPNTTYCPRESINSSNAVIGGTVSEIGGGKFANGAITSAFSMMFNGLMHPEGNKRAARLEYEEIGGGYYSNGVLVGEKPLKSVYPEFDLLLGGSLTKGLGRALKSVNGSIKGFANWVKSKTQGSFFKGTKLSNAAKEKALRGNYHGFPDSVEAFEKYGVRYKAMGKDGNMYEHLDIKGSYHGNDGTFQFIKDGDNIITHRFFKKQ